MPLTTSNSQWTVQRPLSGWAFYKPAHTVTEAITAATNPNSSSHLDSFRERYFPRPGLDNPRPRWDGSEKQVYSLVTTVYIKIRGPFRRVFVKRNVICTGSAPVNLSTTGAQSLEALLMQRKHTGET